MKNVKQVIVIRKDLMNPLDKFIGKMIAQGCHGSLGIFLSMMNKNNKLDEVEPEIKDGKYELKLTVDVGSDLDNWLRGIYTKVCLYVNSEEELLNLYNNIKQTDIPVILITDNGITKFKGKKTNTCIVIGPYDSDKINKFTGNLKLL